MSSESPHIVQPASYRGYSADVRMELIVAGESFPVAQTGGGQIIFAEPIAIPGTTGEVVMYVDGNERRWNVTLLPTTSPSRTIQAQFAQA